MEVYVPGAQHFGGATGALKVARRAASLFAAGLFPAGLGARGRGAFGGKRRRALALAHYIGAFLGRCLLAGGPFAGAFLRRALSGGRGGFDAAFGDAGQPVKDLALVKAVLQVYFGLVVGEHRAGGFLLLAL